MADLASKDEVAGLIPWILKDGHDIDILLNCAGIQRRHPSHLFPQEDWDEVRKELKHFTRLFLNNHICLSSITTLRTYSPTESSIEPLHSIIPHSTLFSSDFHPQTHT